VYVCVFVCVCVRVCVTCTASRMYGYMSVQLYIYVYDLQLYNTYLQVHTCMVRYDVWINACAVICHIVCSHIYIYLHIYTCMFREDGMCHCAVSTFSDATSDFWE